MKSGTLAGRVITGVSVVAALLCAGCRRGSGRPLASSAEAAPAAGPEKDELAPVEKKRSALGRIFAPSAPVGHGWDGQNSFVTIGLPLDAALERSVAVLHSLGFTVQNDQTRKQGGAARVAATKGEHTTALLSFTAKTTETTEVRVRVGVTGDRSGSERILDELLRPTARKKPGA